MTRIVEMDRCQITVAILSVALHICLPFVVCFLLQPVVVLFINRHQTDLTRTGILEAIVLLVVVKSAVVVFQYFLEGMLLFVIDLAVVMAWVKWRGNVYTFFESLKIVEALHGLPVRDG